MDPNDIHLLVILGFMLVACGVLIALLMLFCLSTLKNIFKELRTLNLPKIPPSSPWQP